MFNRKLFEELKVQMLEELEKDYHPRRAQGQVRMNELAEADDILVDLDLLA